MNGMNKTKIETKIGDRFGRLVVISEPFLHKFPKRKSKYPTWSVKCRCDCSTLEKESIVTISIYTLFDKRHLISCGCLKNSGCIHLTTKHGLARTALYKNLYRGMLNRCNNKTGNPKFKAWTDNNIKVCKEWTENYLVFKQWAEEHGYKDNEGLSVDRIDWRKDYCPENCRIIHKRENGSRVVRDRDILIKSQSAEIIFLNKKIQELEIKIKNLERKMI